MIYKEREIWLRTGPANAFREILIVDSTGECTCIAHSSVTPRASGTKTQMSKLNITTDQLFTAIIHLIDQGIIK